MAAFRTWAGLIAAVLVLAFGGLGRVIVGGWDRGQVGSLRWGLGSGLGLARSGALRRLSLTFLGDFRRRR